MVGAINQQRRITIALIELTGRFGGHDLVETKVIPGHGEVSSYADLHAYIAMLSTVRDRIAAMMVSPVVCAGPKWSRSICSPLM